MRKNTKDSGRQMAKLAAENNNHDSTFKIIFEQSPISTQIFAPDGTLLTVNKAWEKLWGTTLKKIHGYNILKDKQLVDKKIMPLIKKAFKGEVVDLPSVKYEPNKTIKDLTAVQYRWTKSLMYPIKNDRGRIQKVVLVHEDITEQNLSEKKLKESEERFRTLIEKSTDAIQLVSPTGEILFTSESIKNVLGYTPDELKGLGVAPFMHPDDLEYFSNKIQELLKNPKKHITMQYRVKHKDGSWAWLETTGVNHLDTPNINALVGNFRNITKRKKDLEELSYQKTLLEAQREVSPEGVLVVSPDGKMVSYNKRFVKMWKFSEKLMSKGKDQQALEDATTQLVDPDKFIKRVKELYEKRQSDYAELHFKDGRVFDRYGAPVVGEDGINYGYVWFFQDVTERKRLELQKDEFLGIASHELKTPVTSLKAFGQVLQSRFAKEGDEKSVILLGKMDAQINKLTNLIEDLLDISKIEGGRIQFHDNYFAFDELVSEVVEELQRTTENHKLIIEGKTGKTIFGDRERIGQVITNFLTNAIKYSPHADSIIIHSYSDKKDLKLCVEDFGVGMPKDTLLHVFERFYRVKGKTHDTVPGMGLGLYISSEIIKRHGGRIWAESVNRKGSSFSFTLPLKFNKKKEAESKT